MHSSTNVFTRVFYVWFSSTLITWMKYSSVFSIETYILVTHFPVGESGFPPPPLHPPMSSYLKHCFGLAYDLSQKTFIRGADKGNAVYMQMREDDWALGNMEDPAGRYTKRSKPARRTHRARVRLRQESKIAPPGAGQLPTVRWVQSCNCAR